MKYYKEGGIDMKFHLLNKISLENKSVLKKKKPIYIMILGENENL